jgi:hypothetical protein
MIWCLSVIFGIAEWRFYWMCYICNICLFTSGTMLRTTALKTSPETCDWIILFCFLLSKMSWKKHLLMCIPFKVDLFDVFVTEIEILKYAHYHCNQKAVNLTLSRGDQGSRFLCTNVHIVKPITHWRLSTYFTILHYHVLKYETWNMKYEIWNKQK